MDANEQKPTSVVRRYSALVLGLLLVAGMWVVLDRHESNPNDSWDTIILATISTAAFIAAALLLWNTGHWVFRVVGLLFMFLGDAILYGVFWMLRIDEEFARDGNSEQWIDLARAFFCIGIPMFVVGMVASSAAWDRLTDRVSRSKIGRNVP
jgi:hypothetical protein